MSHFFDLFIDLFSNIQTTFLQFSKTSQNFPPPHIFQTCVWDSTLKSQTPPPCLGAKHHTKVKFIRIQKNQQNTSNTRNLRLINPRNRRLADFQKKKIPDFKNYFPLFSSTRESQQSIYNTTKGGIIDRQKHFTRCFFLKDLRSLIFSRQIACVFLKSCKNALFRK